MPSERRSGKTEGDLSAEGGQKKLKKDAWAHFFDCKEAGDGIKGIAYSCNFTYTMWKYIIIGAVVLFLFAVFVFSKNHEAMIASNGEIAALQSQCRSAVKKNKDISLDKTLKAYATMRAEWMQSEKSRLEQEKSDLDAQTAALKEETDELQTKYDRIGGEVERIQSQMEEVLRGVAGLVGMDSDSDMEEIAESATELSRKNTELERLVAQEDASINAYNKAIEGFLARSTAARQLNKDRQARISPPELECRVITSDSNWDYVILDAGINKGIVIGSRLAVMRGDKKIGELNVTLVETTRSSCDIVYSTMLPGESVQVGDRVISVRNQK